MFSACYVLLWFHILEEGKKTDFKKKIYENIQGLTVLQSQDSSRSSTNLLHRTPVSALSSEKLSILEPEDDDLQRTMLILFQKC